ncbi:uncharacterized protein RSE6_15013 [Rhynchosporium secalis]|uniref:Uncharacterized protein n=1 Tax=Rhynchosporium secalis TaxID=38038 RepID=A0A1E1MWJ3_RHYSE|nr:uncharacterized protein RSE6_15013 [Rhynchosporium secalis]
MDLILCTVASAKIYGIELRNPHAKFNFSSDNLGFCIARSSRSSIAQLSVDGIAVTREPYHLNQHRCKIQASKLEYIFEWTDFANGNNFKAGRRRYMKEVSGQSHANINIEMPTPLLVKRTIGDWTLA